MTVHRTVAKAYLALRRNPAHGKTWLWLAGDYAQRGLPMQAAYAGGQAARCNASLEADASAIRSTLQGDTSDALLGRPYGDKVPPLRERFAQAAQAVPGDWLTLLYLARLTDLSSLHAVDSWIAQAVAVEPLAGETLHWLGFWRLASGDSAGAVQCLGALLHCVPTRYGSMMYLGEALLRLGQVDAANKAFTRAAQSPNPAFLALLAERVYAHNYWEEALGLRRRVTELLPQDVSAWLALAELASAVYDYTLAEACLARVEALEPGHAQAAHLRGHLQGRTQGAAGGAYLDHMLALYEAADPLSRLASSVAMTSLYDERYSADDIAALHRRMAEPFNTAFARKTDFANPRTSARRLRIGYVTGDLHAQHPVNVFLLPVLLQHDHARFEIFVYHTGSMFDGYTRQAQAAADHWTEAARLSDAALQAEIVRDAVDVLVDLGGHTSSQRLGVFAMGAAPVQATYLGYPHSTGLAFMDWLIGDQTVSPAEHAHLFSEGIAQLPGCVFCWAPVDDYPLPAARPANSPPVFGSFNNSIKIGPRTVALWSRVLQAVPGSQLLLKAPALKDASVQRAFVEMFQAQGIAPQRLLLRGPGGLAQMMQEYGDIDIALDPAPYNGGTTSLQALWMGLPLVTLQGSNFAGRMGASFMRALGRPEWVARDADGYVAIASKLAESCAALRAGRAELRRQMHASPLCDIRAHTRQLEALFDKMWQLHCAGDTTRLIKQPAPESAPRKSPGRPG